MHEDKGVLEVERLRFPQNHISFIYCELVDGPATGDASRLLLGFWLLFFVTGGGLVDNIIARIRRWAD